MAVKEHRIAILLKSLGQDLTSGVLSQVSSEHASSVQTALKELELNPPPDYEVTNVLEEFQRFMDFALSNSSDLADSPTEADAVIDFHSSGDPFEDLLSLQNYQIAGALRTETGGTIAIVLSQLPNERIGQIVAQLPEAVRQESFLRLQASHPIPKSLLTKVIQSTVERASLLDASAASDPDHLAVEKTASLLRAMDRTTRTQMMAALEGAQPELAEQVKGMLFLFEDLLKFTDKSIQRLLGEVESSELATALKNADPDITERVTSNLSKRARATLIEEIEFLDAVTSDREEEARKALCDVFAQLDRDGDLQMIE